MLHLDTVILCAPSQNNNEGGRHRKYHVVSECVWAYQASQTLECARAGPPDKKHACTNTHTQLHLFL